MPKPRCIPTRRDPLFGGWLVLDTLTRILLNSSGPWSAKGNDNSEFERKADAQTCANHWNALLAAHPRTLHPVYRAYRTAQKAQVVA